MKKDAIQKMKGAKKRHPMKKRGNPQKTQGAQKKIFDEKRGNSPDNGTIEPHQTKNQIRSLAHRRQPSITRWSKAMVMPFGLTATRPKIWYHIDSSTWAEPT
jgi:hypothetical protein